MATKDELVGEAEKLFFSKGFRAVSLAGICERLQIRPASLYYHFPKGKEELYLAAVELKVAEFKASIEAIAERYQTLEEILVEFGFWYINQPPMNMMLLTEMDLPYLSQASRKRVNQLVDQSVFRSVANVFERFSGQLRHDFHPYYLVGTFSVLLFSIHTAVRKSKMERRAVIESTVRLFLGGARLQQAG